MDVDFQYNMLKSSQVNTTMFNEVLENETLHILSNDTPILETTPSESLYFTRLIVQKYLVPLVVACGVIGNMFNIIVLINPKMRTSTNTYLMALAICDSLYLLFTFSLSFLHCSNTELPEAAIRYIPFARVFSDLFGNTAVWLTVWFTIERYVAVRLPMKGKAWCTVNKAKSASIVIFFVCLLNTFPEFFETEIFELDIGADSSDGAQFGCRSTDFAKHPSYQLGYYWWFVAVFTFTPLLLLSIFNSLLLRTVWKANKRRQMLSQTRVTGEAAKQNKEQQRVTLMLISVVLIFLFCQTPQAILLVYRSYLQSVKSYYPADLIKIAGNICNLLVQINASVNFLLYSYFSSKFRKVFKRVICRCSDLRRDNSLSIVLMRGSFRDKQNAVRRTTENFQVSGQYRPSPATSVSMSPTSARKLFSNSDKTNTHVVFRV